MSSFALEVLYQDQWLIAVHKPAGYLVHPAENPQPDHLVMMKIVRDHLGAHVYPIHRLDRPTCGVLLLGIDKQVAKRLHKAFEYQETQKVYHAVVEGIPPEAQWSCAEPLQKEMGKPIRTALTDFKILDSTEIEQESISLIEARPMTGRFHQIRRHLLHAGFPIVGDYRYVDIERCDALSEKFDLDQRMLLQAKVLSFTHPLTKKTITVHSPRDPLIARLFGA
ncbi:pseudouridine synthase [Coraliomargarita sp. W4R53]